MISESITGALNFGHDLIFRIIRMSLVCRRRCSFFRYDNVCNASCVCK